MLDIQPGGEAMIGRKDEEKAAKNRDRVESQQRRSDERAQSKSGRLDAAEAKRKKKVDDAAFERERYGIQVFEEIYEGKKVRLLDKGFVQVYSFSRKSASYEVLKRISAQTYGMSGVVTITTNLKTHVLRTGGRFNQQKYVDRILELESKGKVLLNDLGTHKVTVQESTQTKPKAAVIGSNLAEQIQKLADLRNTGVLSEEEFRAAKARLIGN